MLVTPSQNVRARGYGLKGRRASLSEVQNRKGTESGLLKGEGEETRDKAVLKLFAQFYRLDGLPVWDEVAQQDGYHQLDLRGGTERIYINR